MRNLMATKFRTPSYWHYQPLQQSPSIGSPSSSINRRVAPWHRGGWGPLGGCPETSTFSRIASWKCLTPYGPPKAIRGPSIPTIPCVSTPRRRFLAQNSAESFDVDGFWCWAPTFLKCFNALPCSSNHGFSANCSMSFIRIPRSIIPSTGTQRLGISRI